MTPPTLILNFNDTANFYPEHQGRNTRTTWATMELQGICSGPHAHECMASRSGAQIQPSSDQVVNHCRTSCGRFALGTRELVIPISIACASGLPSRIAERV